MSDTTKRSTPPSHRDLIRAARRIRAIARTHDAMSLRHALVDLREGVADHVRLEAEEIDRLPGVTPALARHGQDQVIDLVDQMLDGVDEHDPIDCVVAASALERRLLRQHRLEAALRLDALG